MGTLRGATVGRRFTLLYTAGFLGSGVMLLALAYLLSGGKVTSVAPESDPANRTDLAVAQQQILNLERQLADIEAEQSRQLLVGSLIALVVMAGLSLVLGRVLAGRVLRPLRLITETTRRISAENLDQRLAVAGPDDEVKELADTVDGLLGRLDASFTAQRRFVGNAAHELRTPLATMRASLDVAAAKPAAATGTIVLTDRLRTELDRIDHLLDGFLVLARAEHGSPTDRTRVSLAELVHDALTSQRPGIAAGRLTVHDEMGPDVWTLGSRALLSRMVENIVDNAIVHNEEGGWMRVFATTGDRETHVVVETGGRVLDQGEVDRLTQPFERLGAERTGPEGSSGLGLSIVAAIVTAHGGRLDLQARPAGGLCVAVALPSAPGGEG